MAIVVSSQLRPQALVARGSAAQIGLAAGPGRPGATVGSASAASGRLGGLGLAVGARGDFERVVIDLALRLRVRGEPSSGQASASSPGTPGDAPLDAVFTVIPAGPLPPARPAPRRARAVRAIAAYQRMARLGGRPAVSLRA